MIADHRGIGMTSQRARDRLVAQLRGMGIRSERVLDVIGSTPRHLFVDEALASRAYENSALPIGFGQTISQPYVVALMTQAVIAEGSLGRVLEVGGGCGYQTAILARLAERVYVVERITALAMRLRERLHALRIRNVSVRHGDGALGWPKYGPFDAIVVSAAAPAVPAALPEQLAVGGRLVMPVGAPGRQQLVLMTRDPGGFREESLDQVSFVPLLEGLS